MSRLVAYEPMSRFYFMEEGYSSMQGGMHIIYRMGLPSSLKPATMTLVDNLTHRVFCTALSTDGTFSFGWSSGTTVLSNEVYYGKSRMHLRYRGHDTYTFLADKIKDLNLTMTYGRVQAGDSFTLGLWAVNDKGTRAKAQFRHLYLADVPFDFNDVLVWATWSKEHYAIRSYHISFWVGEVPKLDDWIAIWVQLIPGSWLTFSGEYTGKDEIDFKITGTTVRHLGKPSKSPSKVTVAMQVTLTSYVLLTDYGKVLSVSTANMADPSTPNVPMFTSNFNLKRVVNLAP